MLLSPMGLQSLHTSDMMEDVSSDTIFRVAFDREDAKELQNQILRIIFIPRSKIDYYTIFGLDISLIMQEAGGFCGIPQYRFIYFIAL